jgi:NADH-quinone oxidoreductase subunit L
LYQDAFADELLVKPGVALVKAASVTDTYVVDGAVRGVGWLALGAGRALRIVQNGYVRSYAAVTVAGVVILVALALAWRV